MTVTPKQAPLGEALAIEVAKLAEGHTSREVAVEVIRCAAVMWIRGELEAGETRILESDFISDAQAAFRMFSNMLSERDGHRVIRPESS